MMTKHLARNSMVISVVALCLCHLIVVFGEVQTGLKKDCLLNYDFEGTSKENVFDKSGNKRLATMDNIERREGKCKQGIVLIGRPLRIDEPSFNRPSSKNVSGLAITVVAWIKLNENRSDEPEERRSIFTSFHVSNGTDNNDRMKFLYFRVSPRKKLRWSVSFDVKEKKIAFKRVNDTELEVGVWHHIAVSYNFNQGNESCTFFVNGTEFKGKPHRTKNANNGKLSVYNPPLGRLPLIGSEDIYGNQALNGLMDDFYIYNKTLSKKEIRILMRCNVATTVPSPTKKKSLTYQQRAKNIKNATEADELILEYVAEIMANASVEDNRTISAKNITEEFESIVLILAQNTLDVGESRVVEAKSVETLVLMTKPDSGFTFPSDEEQRKLKKKINESISFPSEMANGGKRAFACIAYSNPLEYMPREFIISSDPSQPNITVRLISKLIGAAVDPPLNKSLNNTVKITFNHTKIVSGERQCLFWNDSKRAADGKIGSWSTNGCKLDKENMTSTKTVCLCNHLTIFALFLEIEIAVPTTTPATTPATVPATAPVTAPATVLATSPATAPATAPVTAPATATATATAPVTAPVTAPATATTPVTAPATAPATTPATAPATAPVTAPATAPAPATTPGTTPATTPATAPTTTPATTSATAPATAPGTAPATATSIKPATATSNKLATPTAPATTTSIKPATATSTKPTPATATATSIKPATSSIRKYLEKIKNKTGAVEFLKNNFGKILPIAVTANTSDDDARARVAMGGTKDAEIILLNLTRKALKVNQSVTVNTSSALIYLTIPLTGFSFPSPEQEYVQKSSETISFPDEMVKSESGKPRAFACIAYSHLHEKIPLEFRMSKPNVTVELFSKIIAAAVHPSLKKPLDPKNRFKITFNHAQINTSNKQVCSFWNHSERASDGKLGSWSSEGCELDKTHSTSTKAVCLCNHLTNFALLLQREGAPYSDPPLSLKIITIIGSTLSILACLLCFLMFFTLKKKDIRHYLHINLAFAIAVAQLILLFGITETKYQILCKILAACLHYFYMVAFFLMLSEGVHLAILIETAFSHGDLKLPIYLSASWGLPLIIVGVTLGARYDDYGGNLACFISAEGGTVYAFVGPFCLILLINFVILFMVLRQVIKKTSLPISSKAASRFEIARATIRSLVILFPVMGFTWIFGILFFGFRTLTLEYLFAIFCSLQGFFIFLFQYALNTENRMAFSRATRRWRLTFTSSTNTSGNNNSKHTAPTKNNFSPNECEEDPNTSSIANCRLLSIRAVDDKNGGTMDSRTASTYI
ncbi:adhesion G protein-coupled receptor L2-like [Dendronephthya gigantea]|uniref:adhesion G protein-coupled receptor L2-like n=1 Tax=Dendronephthya gigantea TaxID=151771 RepID=UPI0010698EA0|nr:adhesion G protein-coupled receptor L2-like [Dendronephthya gigantea]